MSGFDERLMALRAAGEPTRLRLLRLLSQGELTVSEATEIVGQAQPSVSRHLKVLCDAGLVTRHQDGAWAFYGASLSDPLVRLAQELDGEEVARDAAKLASVRRDRAAAAGRYFAANADAWDELRRVYVANEAVEGAFLSLSGARDGRRFSHLIDLGTGTGRMLILFAEACERGTGFDTSTEMLGVARARIDAAGAPHLRVRRGDITALCPGDEASERGGADLVVLHHVLHYLDAPTAALATAARLLSPDGVVLVADLAPHDREALRERHAHRRLGFSVEEIGEEAARVGLRVTEQAAFPPASGDTVSSAEGELGTLAWRLEAA